MSPKPCKSESHGVLESKGGDAGPTPFISDRLSLVLSKPNAKPPRAPGKLAKGRRCGKVLNKFVDLPLDVVLEVSSHLEPMDLLSIARASKDFRAIFMSRKALSVWRRVLEQVKDLPICPRDLTEPQYASFLFDYFCMGCGSIAGHIETEYKLRLRLCKGCAKVNIVPGHRLRDGSGVPVREAFSLLPSNGFQPMWRGFPIPVFDSKENDSKNMYFLPEANLIFKELDARKIQKEQFPKEYDNFISDHRQIASRMMNEGLAIKMWADRTEQEEEGKIISMYRRERILGEISALGWEWRYFPRDKDHPYTKKWNDYLDRPVPFTLFEWNKIRPDTEMMYDFNRRQQLREGLLDRVAKGYGAYRARQPMEVRQDMPPFMDVMLLPCMMQFMTANFDAGATIDLDSLYQQFLRDSSGFLETTKQELWKCMDDFDDNSVPPIEDIEMPKILFCCLCDACQGEEGEGGIGGSKSKAKAKAKAEETPQSQLFGYPDVVSHWVDKNVGTSWKMSAGEFTCTPEIARAASDVLEALGLDKDCSWEEVRALGGLVCGCDHPEYLGTLTFEKLVFHVYSERSMYLEIMTHVSPDTDSSLSSLLMNGHSPDRLRALLRQARRRPEDEKQQLKSKSKRRVCKRNFLCCRTCYQVTQMVPVLDKGMEAHHVRTLHGRPLAKGDFTVLEDLVALYGESPAQRDRTT